MSDFIKSDTFGVAPEGLLNCVFCVMYAENVVPYKNYNEVSKEVQKTKLPFAIMQMRWDGKIGFPGGKVDEGETLLEAVKRELKEELGIVFPEKFYSPVSTFYNDKVATHLFEVKVDELILLSLITRLSPIAQIGSEVLGVMLVPLCNTTDIHLEHDNFLQHNFIASAKLELMNFVKEKGYLSPLR